MKEIRVKTPILNAEIEAASRRQAERTETKSAIPILRQRLSEVIRGHMSLPDKIEGHKVILRPNISQLEDWIDKYPDNNSSIGDIKQQLSLTTLKCVATMTDGNRLPITLSSSVYPSNNEAITNDKKVNPRPASFEIKVEQLDYSFNLTFNGKAFIDCPNAPRYKRDDPGEASAKQIRALEEIVDLIERPNTKFFPQPYYVVRETYK